MKLKKIQLFKRYNWNKLFQEEKYEDALKLLNLEILKEKSSIEKSILHNNIGLIYERMEDFEKAKEEYTKSLKFDSENKSTLTNIGVIHQRLQEFDIAKDYYLKALKLDENFIECRYRLAQVSAGKGLFSEATNQLHKIIEIDPTFTQAYADLALVHKDNEISLSYCDAMINYENENSTDGLHLKGYILSFQKKFEQALKIYDQIIEINENEVEAFMNAGLILEKQGKIDECLMLLEKGLSMNPTHIELMQTLALILEKVNRMKE